MLTVHGDRGRRSGWRNGPTRFNCQSTCVDSGHIAFLFVVIVNGALTIGDGLFWRAAHVDEFHDSFLDRVYNCGVLTLAIKGKDKLGRGIVDNGVRVRRALDFVGDLQGLKIEHRYVGGISIGDKSFAELRKNDNTMAALQAGNGAHYGKVIGIEHFDLSTMREIDTSCRGIYGDVIEIFAASGCRAQRDFLDQVVTRTRRTCQSNRSEQRPVNKWQKQRQSFHLSSLR